ncbi:MAG: tRNA (guanosine(46)-N7)-methyltransferase TrmB [Negativicutes bacterium]|nr:tRNA (guanosine(46)-N7)-methyltransferase TrmB [Negativicutes bacterium]
MRLRKKPWIPEAIKQYEDLVAEAFPGGNWPELFGRTAPLHVELGMGRGRFLCEMAARSPQINFVGIEGQLDVLYYAAQKMAERELTNVKLLHFDVNGIVDIFRPGEVSRLYINFCDPWPKNRHAKRRLTHRRFLDKYRRILTSGGELFFKTDNAELFQFSLDEFADCELKLQNISFDLHNSDYTGNIMTEYEERFSKKGMKIYRCEVIFG